MLYDTLLITERGLVFAFLEKDQLEKIERAYRTNRIFTLVVQMTDGREVVAKNVLPKLLLVPD